MYKTFFAMKKPGINISLIFLIFTLIITGLSAQDTEPADIYLEFSTWKYNDMSRSLVAKITAENDDGEFFVEASLVKFFVVNGENELAIGEAFSGEDGLAVLNIADDAILAVPHPKVRIAGLGLLGESGDVNFASVGGCGKPLQERFQAGVEALLPRVPLAGDVGDGFEVVC